MNPIFSERVKQTFCSNYIRRYSLAFPGELTFHLSATQGIVTHLPLKKAWYEGSLLHFWSVWSCFRFYKEHENRENTARPSTHLQWKGRLELPLACPSSFLTLWHLSNIYISSSPMPYVLQIFLYGASPLTASICTYGCLPHSNKDCAWSDIQRFVCTVTWTSVPLTLYAEI